MDLLAVCWCLSADCTRRVTKIVRTPHIDARWSKLKFFEDRKRRRTYERGRESFDDHEPDAAVKQFERAQEVQKWFLKRTDQRTSDVEPRSSNSQVLGVGKLHQDRAQIESACALVPLSQRVTQSPFQQSRSANSPLPYLPLESLHTASSVLRRQLNW
jgi:hypothetical protein